MRGPLWVPLTFLVGCPAGEPADCDLIGPIDNSTQTAVVGERFASAFGVDAPATFSVIDGELPPGIAIEDTEVVGTPTTAGEFFATLEFVSTAFGESSECTPTPTSFSFDVEVIERQCDVDDDCFVFFAGVAAPGGCTNDAECDPDFPTYCVADLGEGRCIADADCSGGLLNIPFVSVDGVEFTGCSFSGTCTGGLCVRN